MIMLMYKALLLLLLAQLATCDDDVTTPPPPTIIQKISHVTLGSVQCPAGYYAQSCGLGISINPGGGNSEHWMFAIPDTNASCQCYDYYGVDCVADCSNAVKNLIIITASGKVTFSINCPSGSKALGCHLMPQNIGTGSDYEKWRAMYPMDDGSGCNFYDNFGAVGYATCATNIINYEVVKVQVKGSLNSPCPTGKYVLGCGIQPDKSAGPEQFRDYFIENDHSCRFYDNYGAVGYVVCGNYS